MYFFIFLDPVKFTVNNEWTGISDMLNFCSIVLSAVGKDSRVTLLFCGTAVTTVLQHVVGVE